jgi:hypothetical protein
VVLGLHLAVAMPHQFANEYDKTDEKQIAAGIEKTSEVVKAQRKWRTFLLTATSHAFLVNVTSRRNLAESAIQIFR